MTYGRKNNQIDYKFFSAHKNILVFVFFTK